MKTAIGIVAGVVDVNVLLKYNEKKTGRFSMKTMKRLVAVCLAVVCVMGTTSPTNVLAATQKRTKAQIKTYCDKKYKKLANDYAKKITCGSAETYDINQDGIPELFITDCSSSASSEHYSIVYSYNKKKDKLVKYELGGCFRGAGKGYLYAVHTYGMELYQMTSTGTLKLVASSLEGGMSSEDSYYLNGKETTEKKFYDFYHKHITVVDTNMKTKVICQYK